jgi:thiamine-phosphate diphosphorylase
MWPASRHAAERMIASPSLRGIYALVEPQRHADPLAYLAALLRGGIRLFQLRAKGGCDPALLDAIVAAVRAAGGSTIVNDDVTLAERADGVHLGQEDAALHDLGALRTRLGARIIGLSCGTPQEARAAHAAIDYLGVGPIFATASKADAGGPIGANGVRVVVAATVLPVAAIGGITLAALGRVRETGATMAAVISALAAADDPESTARAFVQAWNG